MSITNQVRRLLSTTVVNEFGSLLCNNVNSPYKVHKTVTSRLWQHWVCRDRNTSYSFLLNGEQEKAVDAVEEGKDVCIIGPPGAGKSLVLKCIAERYKKGWGPEKFKRKVGITAMTDLAAALIGGVKFQNAFACDFVRTLDDLNSIDDPGYELLLVDEVSMLSAELLQVIVARVHQIRKLRHLAQLQVVEARQEIETLARGREEAKILPVFRRMQLVLAGDFHSLPPLTKLTCPTTPDSVARFGADNSACTHFFHDRGFAFMAPYWRQKNVEVLELKSVHGWRDQTLLQNMADLCSDDSELRASAISSLNSIASNSLSTPAGARVMKLFCTNQSRDMSNEREMSNLPADTVWMTAEDGILMDDQLTNAPFEARQAVKASLTALMSTKCCKPTLQLKVGARVMLTRDVYPFLGATAGAFGTVEGFTSVDRGPTKIPLPKDPNAAESKWSIKLLEKWAKLNFYPVIKLENGTSITVPPTTFTAKIDGAGKIRRLQVPLTLGWALTVRNAQGLKFDYVKVYQENGRYLDGRYLYSALSCVRSREGLELINATSAKCMVDPNVVEFEKQVATGNPKFDFSQALAAWPDPAPVWNLRPFPTPDFPPEPQVMSWVVSSEQLAAFGIFETEDVGQGPL